MDVDAAPALKRKGADAPELWMDDDDLGGPGFPVASRATKIRRLNADVLPVVPGGAVVPPPPPGTQPVAGFVGVAEEAPMCGDVPVVPVDVVTAPAAANEERAIVLYRPADAERRLLLGPLRPGGHLRVSPDWIHALNGTMLQEASEHRALFEGLAGAESSNLAMVPWAPPRAQAAASTATITEMMEADDGEGASMEVEQDRATDQQLPAHQWPPQQQQQPYMVQPQPIPVTWSW